MNRFDIELRNSEINLMASLFTWKLT